MRTIAFTASLIAFANAGVVHEFFAETNLICNLCKEVIEHSANSNDTAIDEIYALFPKLQARIEAFSGSNDLIDLSQPLRTCSNMNMCEGNESI